MNIDILRKRNLTIRSIGVVEVLKISNELINQDDENVEMRREKTNNNTT